MKCVVLQILVQLVLLDTACSFRNSYPHHPLYTKEAYQLPFGFAVDRRFGRPGTAPSSLAHGTGSASFFGNDEISSSENETHQLVLDAVVGLPEMNDKTLVHLSIVGSHSKQLASHDSDFDVKAVILHSTENYLLQNITTSKSFVTSSKDLHTGEKVEVDGTLVDYLTMRKYVLNSNRAAYDALFGIPVCETEESHYLKQLFCKAYNPSVIASGFQGQLISEPKRVQKNGLERSSKHVANMVYYASAVHVSNNSSKPPSHNAFALLNELPIDLKLRQQMEELYLQRKMDKSKTDVDPEPFASFIESAKNLALQSATRSDQRNGEEQQALREEANAAFLRLVSTPVR